MEKPFLEVEVEIDGKRRIFVFDIENFGTIRIGAMIVSLKGVEFSIKGAYSRESECELERRQEGGETK